MKCGRVSAPGSGSAAAHGGGPLHHRRVVDRTRRVHRLVGRRVHRVGRAPRAATGRRVHRADRGEARAGRGEVGPCRSTPSSLQVDPAWFQRLRLRYCESLLYSAFNFNLRRYSEAAAHERAPGVVWRRQGRGCGAVAEAGAYTRPLLSSTSAVSDTQHIPTTPKHPLHPRLQTLPKHPLNTPCPTKSAYVELTGGRV